MVRNTLINTHRALALAIIITVAIMAAGCSSQPDYRPPIGAPPSTGEVSDTSDTSEPSATQTPAIEAPSPPDTTTATLALLNESERAERSGSVDVSIAYVERAIRISPRQADLWLRRATLALSAKDPEGAIQFARKAISLAGKRADWRRDGWLIIADAEEVRGNAEAAAVIRERWRVLSG